MTADIISTARQLAQQGKENEAAAAYQSAIETTDEAQPLTEANGFLGGWHFFAGRYEEALGHFKVCAKLVPDQPAAIYDLGQAFEKTGDIAGALDSYLKALRLHPRNARYYLYAGAMLDKLERHDEALAVWSLGADIDPMMQNLHDHLQADEDMKEKSSRADTALREHFTELHRTTVGDDEKLTRIKDSIWVQTHTEKTEFKQQNQQPFFFYTPDLPAIPAFDNLEWAPALEPHWQDIRAEYIAAARDIAGVPYVEANTHLDGEWAPLKGSNNWRSIHLFQEGEPVDGMAERFPKTIAALKSAPVVLMNDVPLEVFFSVLEPGTHIPPHFGLANCRMTVHLPLIIPENCRIRVGDEVLHWQEGKLLAFDDSFNHEAWNDSSETRVVLIFEAWAPDITVEEADAISKTYASRTKWLKSRDIPQK